MKRSNIANGMSTAGTMNHLVLVAASLLMIANPIHAADKAPVDWKACSADIEKYCKNVKGDDEIYECLEKNDETISEPCRETEMKYEQANGIKPK